MRSNVHIGTSGKFPAGMKISIIIPTLNEEFALPLLFESLRHQQGPYETIVVDGGSTDQTVPVAREFGAVISSVPGRACQMNAGARLATGDSLLFLHADSVLLEGALAAIRNELSDSRMVGGTFRLAFDIDTPLLHFYAFMTKFRFSLFHYGDQGIFVRRIIFQQLDGFKEIPIMEDLDFLRRLQTRGKTALIDMPIVTSARRFARNGVIRQQTLNTLLVIAYFLGVSPETLKKWYL